MTAVLNPVVMPAVDSPEPGGPGIEELAVLLVEHPGALGMQITLYDPVLDPDGSGAVRLLALLELLLSS